MKSVDHNKKSRVKHEDITDRLVAGFLANCKTARSPNLHKLNVGGLIGRMLSASYFPLPGQPLHSELIERATELFNRYQENRSVTFEYWTEVYGAGLLTRFDSTC